MKVDLTITITLLCITLLHFGQDVNCSSDASQGGSEDRLKRYPSDQDLAFLQKSIKRQGDGGKMLNETLVADKKITFNKYLV